MKKIIGISGVAGCGKDTMFQLLKNRGLNVKRFALADALKKEINPILKKLYKVDIFTCDRFSKDLVRPMLVAHGKVRRVMSLGTHWTNLLSDPIKKWVESKDNAIAVVTDIRYMEYEKDEVYWIKNLMGGKLVHLSQLNESGVALAGINEDEAKNEPLLIKEADLNIYWPKITNFNFEDKELIKHAKRLEDFIRE